MMKNSRWYLRSSITRRIFCLGLLFLIAGAIPVLAFDSTQKLARVKDIATIEGIRVNQLVGYGIVVGLQGTGDSQQTTFPI